MCSSHILEATNRFVAWRINDLDIIDTGISSNKFTMGKWVWYVGHDRSLDPQDQRVTPTFVDPRGFPLTTVLYTVCLPLMHHSATFPNMTKLNVDTDRAGGWFSLSNLLHNAPCLEVLRFDSGLHDEYNNYYDASSCPPEQVPACTSAHLKKVNIGYFNGEEDEFKLVEYFLKNGKVLEKMTITPELDYSCDGPILDVKIHFSMTKRS